MEHRLAAVLAADMVGYSRLMEADEKGTLARLRTHRMELIDPAIGKNHGRIVNSLPTVTPFSRPIVTPLGRPEWAYPRSAQEGPTRVAGAPSRTRTRGAWEVPVRPRG